MGGKITVKIDPDLKELIPTYLEHVAQHLGAMTQLLKAGDFDALWKVGHQLHGSGGGYGLDFLTECGVRVEATAKKQDKQAVEAQINELKDFLERLDIVYADPD